MSADPRVPLLLRVCAAAARAHGARCAARVLDREAARTAPDYDALRDAADELLARGRATAAAHAAGSAIVRVAIDDVDGAVKILARAARLSASTWLRRAAETHPPPAADELDPAVRDAAVAAATAMRAACAERLRAATAHGLRGAYALAAAADDLDRLALPAPYASRAPCATCGGERRVPKPADRDLGYPFAPCPACVSPAAAAPAPGA